MTTKIIKLIYTEEKIGKGTPEQPFEIIPKLYSFNGELVARKQSATNGEKIVQFYPQNIDLNDQYKD